jgi:hypothetical protein
VYSLRAARNDRVKLVHKALAQRLCVLHPLGAMAEKTKTGTRKMGRTGYFSHKDCWKHEMGPGHPECPERLDAIEDRLLITGVFDGLERVEAPLASLADVELAHDRMHVAALRGLTDRLKEEVQAGGPAYSPLDTDTSINVHTWDAALRAAGQPWLPPMR